MNTKQQDTDRRIVRQRKAATPELERMRMEELRSYVYDAKVVAAMFDFGLRHAQPREECGLVTMQRYFVKMARLRGLLPDSVVVYPEVVQKGLRVAENATD